MFYKKIIRPILFAINPEFVHDCLFIFLYIFNKNRIANNLLFKTLNFTSPRIKQKMFGLYFRTPIGLSAGMDKNALASNVWSAFDFGWAQIGSVSAHKQYGNKKPRLWRLTKDKSLVIHYGLANDGAKKIATRLLKASKIMPKRGLLSVSIAKSNKVEMQNTASDIAESFKIVQEQADIITINLSCPNVKSFSGLQKKELLEPILKKINEINKNKKPIWLKIGIDLSKQELDDLIYLAKEYNVDALVATNLSKDRSKLNLISKNKDKPGSISGQPIKELSNKTIAYLYQNSENKYKIIGVGGIFSGKDAYDKIKAGASLLQIATGFIYNGPTAIKNINKELDNLISKDGYEHISKAVGIESKNYSL